MSQVWIYIKQSVNMWTYNCVINYRFNLNCYPIQIFSSLVKCRSSLINLRRSEKLAPGLPSAVFRVRPEEKTCPMASPSPSSSWTPMASPGNPRKIAKKMWPIRFQDSHWSETKERGLSQLRSGLFLALWGILDKSLSGMVSRWSVLWKRKCQTSALASVSV